MSTLEFHGPNAGYALELWENYQRDPLSVDEETRALFAGGFVPPTTTPIPPTTPAPAAPQMDVNKVIAGARLGRLVRELGHLNARLDPLGTEPIGDKELELRTHGLTITDLEALPASVIGGPLSVDAKNAAEALERLRQAYSGSIGYEDDHIQDPTERVWLREAVETGRFLTPLSTSEKRQLLYRLTEVDTFEQFLQTTQPFQGQKRFSIEGSDTMVPVLDTIIHCSQKAGTREVVMGMAHRGRLNVLTHVLGKPYNKLLADFALPKTGQNETAPEAVGSVPILYSGDVKYHKGYQRVYAGEDGVGMPITLAPNPSHLEFVNPAVVGRARAAQEKRDQPNAPVQDMKASLAILIHGDAAFPGQGVVAETLNLAGLKGYSVGGTIHIIANNQVGFTTDWQDARSTLYSSDLAKGFEIPIVHVNGDDVEACIAVAKMACEYRRTFGKDFLIDLIGYRRLGHNEGDEPRFTQPELYKLIDAHARPREVWAKQLEKAGIVTSAEAEAMVAEVRERLMQARAEVLNPDSHNGNGVPMGLVPAEPASKEQSRTVSEATLRELNKSLHTFPVGFQGNDKLMRTFVEPRQKGLDIENGINWAHAESLAYASILKDGTPIRLTGQDVQRGTFVQRHLVFHDVETFKTFMPLQALPQAKASFVAINSPLSEQAAMGFEYGYSIHATETLTLWEGQFGDFANGAQVIIDQFVASGNAKWQQTPSLVLLLPHGYEGQGPEHSSARLERFLQLCAGDNWRVVNCSTAAQYYHLLRRQAAQLTSNPRPLIVMTPKSLLRNVRASSSLADLVNGTFQPVLDDPRDAARKSAVTRLVLCSGKVYVDLVYDATKRFEERDIYRESDNIAIARLEELYPFPAETLRELLASYPALEEVVWVQEEPQNMGAWTFVQPRLSPVLPDGVTLRYIGRIEAASPAEGKTATHEATQARIVASTYATSPAKVAAHTNGKNGKNGASHAPLKSKSTQRTEEQTHAH